MQKNLCAKIIIIILAIALCCLCMGVCFGLYNKGDQRTITLSTQPSVYLVGSFNNWQESGEYRLTLNSIDGTYSLSNKAIPAQSEYKLKRGNDWFPASPAANLYIQYGGVYNFGLNGTEVSCNNLSYNTNTYYLQIKRNGDILPDSSSLSYVGSQYQIEGVSLLAGDQVRIHNPYLGNRSSFTHTKGIDAVGSLANGFLTLDRADTYGFYLTNPEGANPDTANVIYVASTTTKYVITINASLGNNIWAWSWAGAGAGSWYKAEYTQNGGTATVIVVLPAGNTALLLARATASSLSGASNTWGSLSGIINQTSDKTLPTNTNTLHLNAFS